jgi:hypothetical protein
MEMGIQVLKRMRVKRNNSELLKVNMKGKIKLKDL